MSTRKKLRAIMAGKRLVLMPGAYDALSARIIESEGTMTVVGEARNGREAIEQARELKPDIITMDVEMPELDGLAAMKQIIAERRPAPRQTCDEPAGACH